MGSVPASSMAAPFAEADENLRWVAALVDADEWSADERKSDAPSEPVVTTHGNVLQQLARRKMLAAAR